MVNSNSFRLRGGLLACVVALAVVGCELDAKDADDTASGNGGSAGSSGSSGSGGKAGNASGGSSSGKGGNGGSSSGKGGSGGTAGDGSGGSSGGKGGSSGNAGGGGRAGSGEGGDENQGGSDSGGSPNPSGGSGGTDPEGGQAGSETGGTGGSGGTGGTADAGGEGGSAGAEESCTSPSECDDDDACTTDECDGVCSRVPVSLDDSNACTSDTCDRESGVAHTPTTGAPCTVSGGGSGVCSAGTCVAVGCGNDVIESNEDCEDDNTENFDGCNSACQDEASVGPDADILVEDNDYDGTLASMACADLVVSAKGDGLVDLVTLEVGIEHSWVGDLTIKLVSPENTVVTLMSRPGMAETTDDGAGTGAGDSSDLEATSPIVFVDGGATSAESMGSGIANADGACAFDGLCIYAPNNGAAAPGTLASFVGEAAAGTWRFCVGDGNMGDVGIIDSVVLSIVQ